MEIECRAPFKWVKAHRFTNRTAYQTPPLLLPSTTAGGDKQHVTEFRMHHAKFQIEKKNKLCKKQCEKDGDDKNVYIWCPTCRVYQLRKTPKLATMPSFQRSKKLQQRNSSRHIDEHAFFSNRSGALSWRDSHRIFLKLGHFSLRLLFNLLVCYTRRPKWEPHRLCKPI